MFQASGSDTQIFDAVVIGSGATGGWSKGAATEGGMRVAMLEAGPKITARDFTEHKQAGNTPTWGRTRRSCRTVRSRAQCYACREGNYKWFVNDKENPYVQRSRLTGFASVYRGRSNSWGRQSYRMSKLDLTGASHDGYGDNWPVTYEELVPFYEKVERYVGISGMAEGLEPA